MRVVPNNKKDIVIDKKNTNNRLIYYINMIQNKRKYINKIVVIVAVDLVIYYIRAVFTNYVCYDILLYYVDRLTINIFKST